MTPEQPAQVAACVAAIRSRFTGAVPRLTLVLGSGLGSFAEEVEDAIVFAYDSLPGFPQTGVAGHDGRLLLGKLAGVPVALLHGRAHYYEEGRADAMAVPLQTLRALGSEILILTNAAGSLHGDMGPGQVMMITDHINFTGVSPLFGAPGDARFVDMGAAYDPGLSQILRDAAVAAELHLHEGTYMWFAGPQFETPAEIKAARVLGADAAGMSTVPEVILARHAGFRVAALSNITNLAAGMTEEILSHARTQSAALEGASKIAVILANCLSILAKEAF